MSLQSPVDIVVFNEASSPDDVIIRDPFPPLLNNQDWKYEVYGVSPSVPSDAGPTQSIWNDLIYLYPDWNFKILTRLLLDFCVQPLSEIIEKETLVSVNRVLGREGGQVLYLGSKPDMLSFYLLCTEAGLTQLKSRNAFNILFYKYNKVWWQGAAKTKLLAEVKREPGTLSEVIHVLWSLEGQETVTVAGLEQELVPSQSNVLKMPQKTARTNKCCCS